MHRYAIGLGSNRRHGRHGAPAGVIRAALAALVGEGVRVTGASPIVTTPALGPAGRRFANAAALVETTLGPRELLAALKRIERRFGRRRGRRWGTRVLDLDILLWSGGALRVGGRTPLIVPHPGFAVRAFVLVPLLAIAPAWRTPQGATVRHLASRLGKRRPS